MARWRNTFFSVLPVCVGMEWWWGSISWNPTAARTELNTVNFACPLSLSPYTSGSVKSCFMSRGLAGDGVSPGLLRSEEE